MEWDPTQFFRTDVDPPAPFALVVLNQPINENAFGVLAGHARAIVCADGGANHFYEMMKGHQREDTDLPTLIIGDLDSIKPHVRSHYETHGVSIVHDADQYSTDFTKSLKYLRAHEADFLPSSSAAAESSLSILILGGLGGRVDQAFSQIHHLYLMMQEEQQQQQEQQQSPSQQEESPAAKRKKNNLYLISEESITFILQPGQNKISTPRTNRPYQPDTTTTTAVPQAKEAPQAKETVPEGIHPEEANPEKVKKEEEKEEHLLEENIGIIPLSGPARITTHGLQWDVTDWKTEIGGQLSTSNHVRADTVEICVEGRPVLVTVELAERFKRGGR